MMNIRDLNGFFGRDCYYGAKSLDFMSTIHLYELINPYRLTEAGEDGRNKVKDLGEPRVLQLLGPWLFKSVAL